MKYSTGSPHSDRFTYLYLFAFLFFALSISFNLEAQPINKCTSLFVSPSIASKALEGHFVGVFGGIPHGRMHNQKDGEDCWAHALTSIVEASYRKIHGSNIDLSPEYNLFWHVYVEVRQNIRKFEGIRKELESKAFAPGEKTKQETIEQAYGLWKSGHVDVSKGFQLEVGANGAEAIEKLNFAGVMPAVRFSREITTGELENKLERGLAHFVGNYLMKAGDLEKYSSKFDEADAVNTALYSDLVESLMKHEHFLTEAPPRPNEAFFYSGKETTPRKFLHEVMGFDSEEYEPILTTPQTQKLALSAIVDSVKNYQIPVAIGINVYGEDSQWRDQVYQGLLTLAACKGCTEITGGHEVIVVNYLFKYDIDRPTALIIQSSWGHLGNRDINGNVTKDQLKSGYYLLGLSYLAKDENDSPWDMILSKKIILGNSKYKALQKE